MSQFPPRAFIRMAAGIGQSEPRGADSARPPAPAPAEMQFLSLRDVLDRLTISRSLLYELIRDPVRPFPAPAHIGRRSVWVKSEVEDYMDLVIRETRTGQTH